MSTAEWIATAVDLLNILVDAPLPSGLTDTINRLISDQPDYMAIDVLWQPVVDNTYGIETQLGAYEIDIAANGINIGINGIDEVGDEAYAMAELSPDLRLCRRVPAGYAANGMPLVPLEQIRQLCEMLVVCGDLDSIAPRIIVEDWLKTQEPQP
jgi:hypothetical protein